MSDVEKGRSLAMAFASVLEQYVVENESLWAELREAWPQLDRQTFLEQAVALRKKELEQRIHTDFAPLYEVIQTGMQKAEALELLKKFSPTGRPS
jgi:hypothetical protein